MENTDDVTGENTREYLIASAKERLNRQAILTLIGLIALICLAIASCLASTLLGEIMHPFLSTVLSGACISVLGLESMLLFKANHDKEVRLIELDHEMAEERTLANHDKRMLEVKLAEKEARYNGAKARLEMTQAELGEMQQKYKALYVFVRQGKGVLQAEATMLVLLGAQLKRMSGRLFTQDPQKASRLNTEFGNARRVAVRAAVRTVAWFQGPLHDLTDHADVSVFKDVVARLEAEKTLPFSAKAYNQKILTPFLEAIRHNHPPAIPFPGKEAGCHLRLLSSEDSDEEPS